MFIVKFTSLFLFVVILTCNVHSLKGPQLNGERDESNPYNEVGSGDDNWDDDDVPSAPRGRQSPRPNPGQKEPWSPEQVWNNRPETNDNEFEIGGSGDDSEMEERREKIPVVEAPRYENPTGPYHPEENEDEDIGGGWMDISDVDDSDLCPKNYCENDGKCSVDGSDRGYKCECKSFYTGDRCENNDLVRIQKKEEEGTTRGPEVSESRKGVSLIDDILLHPISIAVLAVSGLLLIGLLIALFIICCRCVRKKDEGSYTLDEALQNPKVEYTKVPNGQEFYA